MGFERDITSRADINFPSAYYKLLNIRFDWHRKECQFSLGVWKDKTARDAGKSTLSGTPAPINFKVINQGEDTEFDDYFAPAVLDAAGKNIIAQCYAYAKAKINDPELVDVDPDV
jgi:hypothetical protein